MESVVDRCKAVLSHYRMTVSGLSKLIGISQTTLNNQFNGRNSLSLESLIAILSHFSDVSPAWIILGTGSMFGKEATASNVKNITDMYEKLLKERDDKIRELEIQNVKLRATLIK